MDQMNNNDEKSADTETAVDRNMPKQFGQLLLFSNLITEDQLERALKYQERRGGKLGEILQHLGYISTEDVTQTLGMKYGVPTVNLAQTHVDQSVLKLITAEIAWANRVLPIGYLGAMVACAMEDPTRIDVIDMVEFCIGRRIQPILVTKEMMTAALTNYYPQADSSASERGLPVSNNNNRKQLAKIIQRLRELPPERLEQVQRHLDSITA
jgi:type IV pilus assembly protein PilB